MRTAVLLTTVLDILGKEKAQPKQKPKATPTANPDVTRKRWPTQPKPAPKNVMPACTPAWRTPPASCVCAPFDILAMLSPYIPVEEQQRLQQACTISLLHVLGVHRRSPTQMQCGQISTSKVCEQPAPRANTKFLLMTHWRAMFYSRQ